MFITDDGSMSLKSLHFDESYHSKFGAVTESQHIFIHAGLQEWYLQNSINKNRKDLHCERSEKCVSQGYLTPPICIFEMGFGTGLNAILALQWAEHLKQSVFYHAIELFPLSEKQLNALNYADFIEEDLHEKIHRIKHGEWNQTLRISEHFTLYKHRISLLDIQFQSDSIDVVFFDAFSPNVQPELWTEMIFRKMYHALHENAILTTYCVKGEVRRAMKSAGFWVEKIQGPMGKREITRAVKRLPT